MGGEGGGGGGVGGGVVVKWLHSDPPLISSNTVIRLRALM